jgi:hypothetical protein
LVIAPDDDLGVPGAVLFDLIDELLRFSLTLKNDKAPVGSVASVGWFPTYR